MFITKRSWLSLSLAVLLLAANFYLFQTVRLRADGLSRIYFLDVGQGDGVLIRTADGENILVDGGPTDSIVDSLNRYLPISDRTLDLVLLTHAHADHAAGLLSVVQQFPIGQFWYSGAAYDSKIYNDLLAEVTAKSIPINLANSGDQFLLSRGMLNVVYPAVEQPAASDPNDTSIVANLKLQDFDLLLTGDINSAGEHQLIASGQISPVEVLKVAHHGSQTSSSNLFLQTARPGLGVISLGASNTYGHPHQEVLDRFSALSVPVLRTDQHGTIQIMTDGRRYKAVTAR
jgi:competence protein ComEC